MTQRELKLMLRVLELEVERARLLEDKWRAEPEEDYVDGPDSLSNEIYYAMGAVSAWREAARLINDMIDA